MGDSITPMRAKRMRRPMSPPEARLWVRVRARRLEGCKFRRQHPCGPFILDFYCAAARLAVEVDGESHNHPDQISHDRRRTRWLAAQGIRVVRIAAVDVRDELDGVLAFILRVVRERTAHRSAAPSTPRAKSPGRSSSPSLTGR
ncbi:endonuclease domain-containing protein [Brevundimonas sp.]|uniref:endonuclease domain-containing protein n=1 Tax=Brevundimonas sp. TaxID=1871086 RepID=UPI001D6A2E32|nr:endonuclease domain-containing protein [Brevundimonas sp.]